MLRTKLEEAGALSGRVEVWGSAFMAQLGWNSDFETCFEL